LAVTITGTHYTYPRRDGQAEVAWLGRLAWLGLYIEMVYRRTVTDLSIHLARRRRVTSLISPTMLPLYEPNHHLVIQADKAFKLYYI